ncbi:MAG TPA: chemotaxis protein CheC [Candidatus Limnocylindria bacterium]|jgi:chemotaxis protein CheC|nr:chemotaxis protein CheC [Candidatus Limnocylindria bacterium]
MPALELNELQRDALREVGNIGAGHAATALSQMLNRTVRISEPSIEILKFGELATRFGDDAEVAAVHMAVLGDAPGQMLVLFDRAQAVGFVETFITRLVGDIQVFDSIADSTLKEIGNIIAGAYLTALMSLTGTNLLPSIPTLSSGTARSTFGALFGIPAEQEVFLIETGFLEGGPATSGQFLLIPDAGSLQPLFSAFGLE